MLMFKHDFIIICPVMALTYMGHIEAAGAPVKPAHTLSAE